jgi:hypothetical protein
MASRTPITVPSSRPRGYIANRVVLELDGPGNCVGTLHSVDGGDLRTESVAYRTGMTRQMQHLAGRPRYDDVTIQVGMTMAPRFWEWLKGSFSYDTDYRNGALVGLDYNNKERWRRTFQGAMITEMRFPALDSSAREADYLTIRFAVERIEQTNSEGRTYHAEREDKQEWHKQSQWLPSSFTFKIDQFGRQDLRTARIESFTIKQSAIDCPCGAQIETAKVAGLLEFPNLEVTVLESDAKPWLEWYERFRGGEYGKDSEKSGHLSFLQRQGDRTSYLMTLDIQGMGILRLRPQKSQSSQQGMGKLKIELYCDTMALTTGAGNVAA